MLETITENTAITIASAANNTSCLNSNDGSVVITATGGQSPFMYSLDGGAFQPNNTFNGLSAGMYSIDVIDANSCTASGTALVLIDSFIVLSTSMVSNVSCAGMNDGQVQLSVSGGYPPFTFSVNGTSSQSDSLFTGLGSGLYLFEVIDGNGCSDTTTVTILENPPMVVSLDSITEVLCSGDASGAIYVSVAGGDGSYTYAWTGAGTSTSQDITNTVSGSYNLTVTDGSGCTAFLSATISSPTELVVSLSSVTNVSCNGGSDGSIDVSISGGTTSYSYSWSDGTSVVGTLEDLNGVVAGTYTLTVTDGNGCVETLVNNILENTVLAGSISTTDILCFGENGSAMVSISGGSAPYTYFWSNFDTASMTSGLNEGMISVIITDSSNCTLQLFDTIFGPSDELDITNMIQNVSCFAMNDGEVVVVVTGGTPPYLISISGGSFTNLIAGTYTIDVVDDNGCTLQETVEVLQPSEIMTTLNVTNPDCYNEETGMIVASTSGGTAPYTYSWNTLPVQNGLIAINLGDGLYVLTTTDSEGCIVFDSATVVNPQEFTVSSMSENVTCVSNSNGSVSVETQGGNAPFEYQLNGFLQTDSVFSNLSEGHYTVFVIDNNNCTANTSFDIGSVSTAVAELEGAGNDLVYVTDNLYIVRGEDVTLNVNILNDAGNTIVGYNWIPSELDSIQSPTFSPNDNITVIVEVLEDINGSVCSLFDTLEINVSQEYLVFIPTAFSPNNEGVNNFFEMNVLGAKNLNVQIFNRWGELVFENNNQGNGPNKPNDPSLLDGTNPRGAWDGKYKGEDVPTGSYVYKIEVTNFDDSIKILKGSITVIR